MRIINTYLPLRFMLLISFSPDRQSAPDYKFFDVNFASSVGRRVAIFDSGRDSTGHFAIVDQDGSLTRDMTGGGCGASIVGMSSHMRHSGCEAVGDTKVLRDARSNARKQNKYQCI